MKTNQTDKPNNNLPLKIAVLSDVHGNLPALEAVIADAQKQNADEFWNLGDLVGYGPFVKDVVDLLFETCSAQVVGNYDLKVLKFSKKQKKWQKNKKREKYLAFEWAWENLSPKNAKRLKKLPQQDRRVIGVFSFLLTHGGPAAVDEAIGPDTPVKRLEQLVAMTDAEAILCGHTHLPFLKTVERTTFINPGSVGRPEGQDPRAAYVILDISSNGLTVSFQKVSYDIERLSRAVHAAGLPDDFTKMFKSGQNLDQVQGDQGKSIEISHIAPETIIAQAQDYLKTCAEDMQHSEQVKKLSILLFEKLRDIHHFGSYELFLLTCAALLHDIGWVQGQAAHHKAAMQMICSDTTLSVTKKNRIKIAVIARYHRKALPKATHACYKELSADEQRQVSLLAGILRIADGLDRSHMSVVEDIDVKVSDDLIEFCCKSLGPASSEMVSASKKSHLFEKMTGYKTCFSVTSTTP